MSEPSIITDFREGYVGIEEVSDALMAQDWECDRLREKIKTICERLREVHSAIDDSLGDTDITHIEDEDQLRDEEPAQWAAREVAGILYKHDLNT